MPSKSAKMTPKKRGKQAGSTVVTGATRAGLVMAPARCSRALRAGRYAMRTGASAGVYMAGVLQFLCEEILELAGEMCLQHKKKTISPKHLNLALRADEELAKMLFMSQISEGGMLPNVNEYLLPNKKGAKDTGAS